MSLMEKFTMSVRKCVAEYHGAGTESSKAKVIDVFRVTSYESICSWPTSVARLLNPLTRWRASGARHISSYICPLADSDTSSESGSALLDLWGNLLWIHMLMPVFRAEISSNYSTIKMGKCLLAHTSHLPSRIGEVLLTSSFHEGFPP